MIPHHFKELVLSFLWQHPGWVATNTALMAINFPIELILLSYLSGQIVLMMVNIKKNYNKMIRLIMYFFLAYFIIEISLVGRDSYDAIMIPELERMIRNQIIIMILEKNEIQYNDIAMGELITRFLKAPIHSYYAYHVFMKFIVPFVLALIIINIYVYYLNHSLGCAFTIIYTVFLIILYYMSRIMIEKSEEKMRKEMIMFNKLEDTLNNMQTIFTSDTVEQEKRYMDKQQLEFSKIQTAELNLNARMKIIMSICSLVSIIFIFIYAIYLFRQNKLPANILVSVVTLLLYLCRFIGFTCRRIMEGMMTIGSIMESNQFIDQLKKDTFHDGTAVDFIHKGDIEFRHVSFRYRQDSPLVFNDFSIRINGRSRIALIGDSGSGKTTFLRLLLGFFNIQHGEIIIDGTNISYSRRSYLRNRIAYVNQNTRLFDRSIIDNILYGCTQDVSMAKVEEFLDRHHLSSIFHKIDNNLKMTAGRGGENLSGGMRQIILLLRCYFRDCPIVILDEATSSIDAHHRQYAMTIIKEMFTAKTVIAVTHDKDISDLFNTKLIFSYGKQPVFQS